MVRCSHTAGDKWWVLPVPLVDCERGLWWERPLWRCFSLSPQRSLTSPVRQREMGMWNFSHTENTERQTHSCRGSITSWLCAVRNSRTVSHFYIVKLHKNPSVACYKCFPIRELLPREPLRLKFHQKRVSVLERKSNRLQKLYKTASAISSSEIHAIWTRWKRNIIFELVSSAVNMKDTWGVGGAQYLWKHLCQNNNIFPDVRPVLKQSLDITPVKKNLSGKWFAVAAQKQ